MLGSPILYVKGMRLMMFQLSGFYHTCHRDYGTPSTLKVTYAITRDFYMNVHKPS